MSGALMLIKAGAHVAGAVGVSKVLKDVIFNNVNIATTGDLVKVWTGTIVLGSLITEHAAEHLNNNIDTLAAWYYERKAEVSEEVPE